QAEDGIRDFHVTGVQTCALPIFSYICCEPIAGITLNDEHLRILEPNGKVLNKPAHEINLREEVSAFRQLFSQQEMEDVNVISSGLFGYFTFDAVEHFEDITLTVDKHPAREIPYMQYHVYRYVIAIDHFRNQLYIFENLLTDESSDLDRLEYLIQNKNFPEYHFKRQGGEASNMTDEDFRSLVDKMKHHIQRGDVFQIVPSRA